MKKLSLRSGLLATTTICGAALSTMAGGALVATVATMLPAVAQAQDYTSGALVGTVTDSTGKPVSGATVTLTSVGQGQARTLTTATDGTFHASGLPAGEYNVAVSANGYTDYSDTVSVVISQEVRYSFALQQVGVDVQTVVVKGKRLRQDFTKTTTGLTVDLETLTSQQPIARNLTAVTLLAPTVTKGNPGFGNVASFGGGSVAENAYYIDGLNITNPDTYVGSASVPFDFYKTIEVKTGGYSAEFGRATGGVVNATTKSGTNQFTFAVHGNYQPADLREEQKDTYANRGEFSEAQANSLGIEAGGPIIKDHLFAYGLYQVNDLYTKTAAYRAGTYTTVKNKDPFLGLKLDGYITPTQHFAFTYFDTTNEDISSINGFTDKLTEATTVGGVTRNPGQSVIFPASAGQAGADFALNPTNHAMKIGDALPGSINELGGKSWVFNYNGKVTDWFTVSAAIGDMKDRNNVLPEDITAYYVIDTQSGTNVLSKGQPSGSYTTDATERKFYRLDSDFRFDLWGRHHVRAGYDHEENSMTKLTRLTGAEPVRYDYTTSPDEDNPEVLLHVIYENLGGNVSAENSAFYIQDLWDVTSNLNLQIGLRSDDFKQNNLSGEEYLSLTGNVAPRLGFSYDPTGEGKWKIFGSFGANFIPPAMNLGYRGKDLYFEEYFSAPAGGWVIDPTTGLPSSIGTPFVWADTGFNAACPVSTIQNAPALGSAAAGVEACNIHGNGEQEGATSKTSLDLKATQEDEYILGTTYRVNDLWTLGLTYTHRELKRVSEDLDFNDAIISYLDDLGLDSSAYAGAASYYVWNVGDHDVTINLKQPVAGLASQTITLTADQLGHYHEPTREYDAVVFDFKRAFDGKWGVQGSYTWSRSYGNYEGTVKSDVGNGVQTDAGATIAYDSPGFEDYGTGLLGNDRTHQFKIWGSYAITPDFIVGANIQIESPLHFSCLGVHPTDPYAGSYGPYSHFCNGEPSPLGKGNKSDWTKNVDVAFRYTVPEGLALGGKLVLRADIFNLFDIHSIVTRRVTYETTGPGVRSFPYGQPTAYNTPRYVRLGFDLNY
ncbi:Protein oar [Asticcacaulis sp. MM231]|uniref:TonB-dependent receptor n=1 Tax=Asticcacaulis sp. MM231 TaxID=3157666 RepID=UPI0032D5730C